MRSRPVEDVAATDAQAQAGPPRQGGRRRPCVRAEHSSWHYELVVEVPANRRVAVAFDDLAMAI
jgi:hypothetical protein